MELKGFERLKGPDESVMMVSERTGSKHVHQASPGYPRWESDTMGTEPVAAVSPEGMMSLEWLFLLVS